MTTVESRDFCCERCGSLIKGKARQLPNGKIVHIGQCSNYANAKERRELAKYHASGHKKKLRSIS